MAGVSLSRRWQIGISLAYVALVAIWSIAIPYDGAPDERTHFFLVEYLYRFGAVPVPQVDPAEPLQGLLSGDAFRRNTFWYYGLPYLHSLGATGFALVLAPILPSGLGYLAVRAFNWMLAGIFMASLLDVARTREGDGWRGIAAVLAVTLIPQVTFLFAYFNADAFALSATALALALLLRVLRSQQRGAGLLLAFGAACGLILCSKLYYFPALVFFGALIVVDRFAGFRESRDLPRMAGWVLLGALAIAGPVLAVTWSQFGDVTGLKGQTAYVAINRYSPGSRYGTCFFLCEEGLVNGGTLRWWLQRAAKSFFMTTGWMSTFLPQFFYQLFLYPLTLALAGWSAWALIVDGRRWRRRERVPIGRPVTIVLFWGMAAGVLMMNLLGQQRLLPQPQGRYLFVVIPFAVLLLSELMRSAGSDGIKPGRSIAPPVLAIAALGMAVTNATAVAVTARANGGFPALGAAGAQGGLPTQPAR